MARRFPSILQVALLLAVLAGVAWLWSLRSRAPQRPSTTTSTQMPAFEEKQIAEIVFERGGGMRRVVREEDGFWIRDPYRDRADDRFLAQSLRVAATLKPDRVLPDTAPALFGLEPPTARWSCVWPGGSHEIILGDTLPAGAGRYARTGHSPHVLVVDAFLARRFLSPPFRDIHQPVAAPLDVGQLDSVRIETREEKILAVRQRGGSWEILSPIRVHAATEEIDRAVKTLRTESMTEFLGPVADFDLPSLGLSPPRATWTLILGRQRATVRIGHPTLDQESVHLIPSGRTVVALIGSEQFRIWVDGMKRLRDTQLLDIQSASVASLEVAGEGLQRRFFRLAEGGWAEEKRGDTLLVRSDALEIAVANLCAGRAVDFPPESAWSSFQPLIRLYLAGSGGERDTLELAAPQGDRAAVRTRRQPGVCQVPAAGFRTWELWLHDPLRP